MIVLGYDLESTGLDVKSDRIIEVGAIVYDTSEKVPLDVFSAFILPPPELAEDYISPTGIKREWLLKYGIPMHEAFGKLQQMICRASPVAIVGHNVEAFDKPLTIAELRRHNILEHAMEAAHYVDTRHDIPFKVEPTSRRLKHLAADIGIMNPFEHRAIFDVLTMFKIVDQFNFSEMLEQSKLPWINIRILASYDNRQKAKDLRYVWDGEKSYWSKKIKEKDFSIEQQRAEAVGLKVVRL